MNEDKDCEQNIVLFKSDIFFIQSARSTIKVILIPSNISIIPKKAFFNCLKLEIVNVPNTILKIG